MSQLVLQIKQQNTSFVQALCREQQTFSDQPDDIVLSVFQK